MGGLCQSIVSRRNSAIDQLPRLKSRRAGPRQISCGVKRIWTGILCICPGKTSGAYLKHNTNCSSKLGMNTTHLLRTSRSFYSVRISPHFPGLLQACFSVLRDSKLAHWTLDQKSGGLA